MISHNCPKCNKPVKIQAEFPVGTMVNYVYMCGHLELRTKFMSLENQEHVKIDGSELKSETISDNSKADSLNSNGIERDNDLVQKLSDSINYIKESKVSGGEPQNNIGYGHRVILENDVVSPKTPPELNLKVPEPTYKELYEDLDNWVTDGGAIKETPPIIPLNLYSVDWTKRARDYQIKGIEFAEKSKLSCIIADAVGVGKTLQGLKAIQRNKTITHPCLYLVKGATMFQWYAEHHEYVSNNFASCMILTDRNRFIPGFECYILSHDMLSKNDIIDKLLTLNIKSVIIDEIQAFKDPSAKRTKGLLKFLKFAQINYKIMLSGTPIKNKFSEYGVALHIASPGYFKESKLDTKWLAPDNKSLNPLMSDLFKETTKDFVLRREKHEVLKSLPALTRDYQIIDIDDPAIKNTYNHTLSLFKNWMNDNKSKIDATHLLGWLAKLRAITGQAKCKNALEWTRDFLDSTDESLAIGIHHHSVRDTLYGILDMLKLNPLKFSGEDNVYKKNEVVRQFTNGVSRVLVINAIAGGVGLNLQTCANALVIEREWNSADEEQFEARFHRSGQQKAVTVTYLIAKGTIDEFFHEMVISKRRILANAGIGSNWDLNSDISTLKNFADMVVNHKI